MKSRRKQIAVFLEVLVVVFLLAGGKYYINSMEESLWQQSVSDVLEVTAQGSHVLEVYIEKDMALLDSIAAGLSQLESGDKAAAAGLLELLGGVDAELAVVDFEHGLLYSGETGQWAVVSPKQLAEYEGFADRGVRKPYFSETTGQDTLGYSERFSFADGTEGMLLLGRPLSEVMAECSLSFYGDTGFSYVVNWRGDILIRPLHKSDSRSFGNLFQELEAAENSIEELETFYTNLLEKNSSVARLMLDGEKYIFAYVSIQGTEGWNFISVIPDAVVTEQAGRLLKDTQRLVVIIGLAVAVAGLFTLVVRSFLKSEREKEDEVRSREQLFGLLAVNTDEVFLLLAGPDYKVEYVSPNVERVLGVSGEAVRASILSLGRAEYAMDADEVYRKLQELSFDGSVVQDTERIHKKTGERKSFRETVYRVKVENFDRYIAVLSDRTEEMRREAAMREALEIARVANESKSTFLSNMSHDIRTPMNAIMGLTALLQRDAGNPERVLEHTRKITASSRHLLSLINDILDMSKIESGKTTLEMGEVNLAELVDELLTIMRPQAAARQQELEINVYDVSVEHLLGDKLRINQVLINILSNAVKYTPPGGRIEMVVRQSPQGAGNYVHLQFVVRDNGIGMSREYQEKIFQPFSREINSTTNSVQGTGLGMAITKNLVDLMGGTISVESSVGEGSTFTVDLELRVLEREENQDFWVNQGISRALVVDDEMDICTGILNAMAGTGVAMEFSLEGAVAVRMVESAHRENRDFDLILLDWKMPGMDGIETARRIREIMPDSASVVLLSAYDWDEIEGAALEAGINGFLSKPFFLTNFIQKVKELRTAKAEEAAPAGETGRVLEGKHFLAAEDNDLNGEILLELLDMKGASCELAEDGRKALELFEASEEGKYDAILMDVQMPVMNGYEATRAIRGSAHPQARTIPIIAMTANAFTDDIRDALDAGMDAHMAKPLDIEQLELLVRDILAGRRNGGPSGTGSSGGKDKSGENTV